MKKKSFILVFLLVLSRFSMAQGVQYFQGDVYDALLEAKKQQKILLVECYADWNYKSKWMNNMMNTSEKVLDFFSKNVVVWKIDTSTPGGAKFAVDYQVKDYPSLFVFNRDGVVINKIDKAMEPDELIGTLDDDIFTLDGGNLWKMQQLEKYANNNDRETADAIFTEYLQHVGKQQVLKESNRWIFRNRTITYYYSTAFDFLLENRNEFADSIFVRETLHNVMHDYLMESLLSKSIADTVKLKGILQFTTAYLPEDATIALFFPVIESQILKDYDCYISAIERLISSLPEDEGPQLAFTLSTISTSGTSSQKAQARAIVYHQMITTENPSTSASLEILYNSL